MSGKIFIVNDHGREPYEAPKAPDIDSQEAIKFFGLDQMNDNEGNRVTIEQAREIMKKRFGYAKKAAKDLFVKLNS